MTEHPSDRLGDAVQQALGDQIRSDFSFAAQVWGALVYNNWFDANGEQGMLTMRGANDVIMEVRGYRRGEPDVYLEGGEGPPPQEMQDAMAAMGWRWEPDVPPKPNPWWKRWLMAPTP